MNYEDFIRPKPGSTTKPEVEEPIEPVNEEETREEETIEVVAEDNIDVQKAVVESLAAEKVEQDERITKLLKENYQLKTKIGALNEIIEMQKAALEKTGDVLSANHEGPKSNQVTLLERNPDLNDRFESETYDHVIEVLKEAREAAEKSGRIRRAQILEAVLLANEETGNLAENRAKLKKLFDNNANTINGEVIEALTEMGLSYKNGEEYLLVGEILNRAY